MSAAVAPFSVCPGGFTDFTFKTENGVPVPLRLWAAGSGAKNAPWIFWIHGGGWIAGKHWRPNWWVNPAFTSRGYHIVSVGYRYIPEVSIDDIIKDVMDGFAWCRKNLPDLVGKDAINLDAYAVGGDSAGGSLCTQMGILLEPSPRCVVDLYGVVDLSMAHYHEEVSPEKLDGLSHPFDEVKKAAASRDSSQAMTSGAFFWEFPPERSAKDLSSMWGTPYEVTDKDRMRMDVYLYLTSNHLLFKAGLRRENYDSDEAFISKLKSISPLYMIDEKKSYPPTVLIHGTKDEAVPIEQSYQFENKLKALNVPVLGLYEEGAGHNFESKALGPNDKYWNEYIVPTMDFVDKHVKN
ncbi:Alpha/Beta hydrolase protein [Kockovaella imperatae]|uniref:Alpha/Beta hydrolase protein n=1 Tax=Kockovaella imperatae TaxID=4999 RepID=A0A1Y1UIJ6_9TREE|nr:Alpha/Beta hydrolase protein [Kockovaella imperatae]ORX37822.1 Alpha/Beta hydrolase protein [Kockovaella imperatae]